MGAILTKKELNEAIKKDLYQKNDKLLRELASALVELQLLDKNGNGKLISENDRLLLEANFFQKIKEKWKNLWSPGAASTVNSAISKLSPEDQKLLQNSSKAIAEKYGEECINDAKAQGLTGDDLKLAVQNCLSSKITGGPLQKMLTFFRKPLSKTAISSLLLVMVLTKVFPAGKTTTTVDTSNQNKVELKYDSDLFNKTLKSSDTAIFNYADAQGVTTKSDAPVNIPLTFDTGSAKIKADQQERVNDFSQEVIKNVKDRIEAGEKNITVSLEAQGNASNDSKDWNHNNDTDSDSLNQDRANTTAKALQPLVKTLQDMGVDVKLTKSVGDKGSEVKSGTNTDTASKTSFISVNIDGKVDPTTTTEYTPGTPWQPERDFPAPKVLGCNVQIPNPDEPGNTSSVNINYDDKISFYGRIEQQGKIQIKKDGQEFAGILSSSFSKYPKSNYYDAVVLGGFESDGSVIEKGKYVVLSIKGLEGQWLIDCGGEVAKKEEGGEDIGPDKENIDPNKEPGIEPSLEPGGGETGGKIDINPKTSWVNKEMVYNDLAGFFQFTHNNRKAIAPENFNECRQFKVGSKVFDPQKQKAYIVIDPKKYFKDGENYENETKDGKVWVIKLVDGKQKGGTHIKACSELRPFKENIKKENIMKKDTILTEGRFIKDPGTIEYMVKSLNIDKKKIKFFEGFMTRLEIIRNKIRKMDATDDKVLNSFITKLKTNPIMQKDFTKTFNIPSPEKMGNPQNVQALANFINQFLEIVYSGRFRGETFKEIGGMVDKMGVLGGGNINKVSKGEKVEESYLIERKGKKAKATSDFKNNIINFITVLMGMFQYLSKLKVQGKLEGSWKGAPKPKKQKQQESIQRPENKFLKEEVRRIKSLMYGIK